MDDLSKILESSFAKAGAREDAHWETLTAARGEIASRANVPAVTARKWMSILESGSETISAPSNQKIIEKITKWAGPESTAQWLDAYRDFEEASRRTHRSRSRHGSTQHWTSICPKRYLPKVLVWLHQD